MQWLSLAIDYGVLGLLAVMSFVVVMIAVERTLFYRNLDLLSYTSRTRLELHLGKNLSIIGTITSNAPYVGLLGTVLGIMLTFYTIGMTDALDTREIMVSLSLALKATAAGLVVAILGVVLYNTLSRKCKDILLEWDVLNEG